MNKVNIIAGLGVLAALSLPSTASAKSCGFSGVELYPHVTELKAEGLSCDWARVVTLNILSYHRKDTSEFPARFRASLFTRSPKKTFRCSYPKSTVNSTTSYKGTCRTKSGVIRLKLTIEG